MANICDNIFYAYSESPENIQKIKQFFENWKYEGGADYDGDENCCDVYFASKWSFPEKEMNELLNSLPNKDDIFMRCLSYELENLYHELLICEGENWKSI